MYIMEMMYLSLHSRLLLLYDYRKEIDKLKTQVARVSSSDNQSYSNHGAQSPSTVASGGGGGGEGKKKDVKERLRHALQDLKVSTRRGGGEVMINSLSLKSTNLFAFNAGL